MQKPASLDTRFALLGMMSRLEPRLEGPREPVAGIVSVPRGQSKGAMATFAPITLPLPLPSREGSQEERLLPLGWGRIEVGVCAETRVPRYALRATRDDVEA